MNPKSILFGLAAAVAMIAAFFGITALANSLAFATSQFADLWYWILPLAAGFGIQIALHVHIREKLRERRAQATAGVAASGGVSTLAMVACCVHRVTDVLPFLGASAAAVFLVQYQTPFLVLGLFSNLLGILFLLRIMQRHGIGPATGPLNALLARDLRKGLAAVAVIGLISVGSAAAFSGLDGSALASPPSGSPQVVDLPVRENAANGLAISVEPIDFAPGSVARFEIGLNTHAGSLAIDFVSAATLYDDKGNAYPATAWDGPPPGGHHLMGALVFPPIEPGAQSIRLVLRDVYDVPERVFEWQLR